MNDLTLALMGLSTGAGSVVGAWAALWWRDRVPRNRRRLVRHIFPHVDEVLGARKKENDRRAKIQPVLEFVFGRKIARVFAPLAGLSGSAARPSIRRMGRYVTVSADRQQVILHYTSEAAANGANFIEWLERGRPREGGGLAQALGLEWTPGMFEVSRNWSRARVTFTRVKPAAVDADLRAEAELG